MKICGITELAAAEAAVEAGADAVGFVFASSPRQIDPRDAVHIAGELPPATLRVAVFRRPELGEIETVLDVFTPHLVQADHESLGGFAGTDTLPVYREGDVFDPDGGRFLYEGPISGVGQTVDMARAAEVARMGDMVLAGGLRPDNVADAIRQVGPYGVDVSSGVEASPGVKDPALIRSFVAAVRAAEERAVRA